MIYGVILAGGKGERFWPLSRAGRPKQLLRLISDKTMLQETLDRILPLIPKERIYVVTSENMVQPILEEISDLGAENMISEPRGRNTCLAIGLAAEHLKRLDPKAVMVVLSADHIIRPAAKLLDIIRAGAEIASQEDCLITIGIEPTRAETSYGYIKLAGMYKAINGLSVYQVDSFTEKPKPTVAQQYYYGRQHLWNSGMFIWSVESVLQSIHQCQPEMGSLLSKYAAGIGSVSETSFRNELYEKSEPISIDFAVLENAANVLTIKADLIWDDVGSWNALERYKERDQENNVVVGDAHIADSYETTVYNETDGIIVALGVSDLVIVKTNDIVLVAHKTKADEVKRVLAEFSKDESLKKYL